MTTIMRTGAVKQLACTSVFLATSLSSPGIPAAPEVPLEAYGRPPLVSRMAISPDGDRVAFRRVDSTMDAVFAVDRNSGEIIGAVDSAPTNIRQIEFLDQDQVLLLGSWPQTVLHHWWGWQQSFDGSFVLDLRTQEMKQLLKYSGPLFPFHAGTGRIVGYDPHRGAIYLPATVGKQWSTRALGLFEAGVDSPNGALIAKGVADTIDWFVDDHGRILAEEGFDPRRDVRRIWSRASGERKLIYEAGRDLPEYAVVGLSRDLESLVVSARVPGSDFSSYFPMSLADGSVGPALFQRESAGIERPLTDATRRVYGVEYSGFYPRYEFFDEALTERVQAIQSALAPAAAYLEDWGPDFRFLLFRLTGGWTAGAYAIVDPDSLTPHVVMGMREGIPGEAVVPTRLTRYVARDGLEIPALVTVRADVREAGNAPLIVLPHGGPENYDRYGFHWLTQYFASRGMAVLQPQFRGSRGFGATLRNAGKGEWGAGMSTDLDDGVKRLVEAGLVNPARVCIVGRGYGGYAALAAGAYSSLDYRCVVSIAGPSDLPRMLGGIWSRHERAPYWRELLGVENEPSDTLDAVSPVNFAENFTAPVLLVHGQQDMIVPIDQSLRMESALRDAGKRVKLVRLEGETHHLSGYDTRVKALRIIAKFIEDNLLDRSDTGP